MLRKEMDIQKRYRPIPIAVLISAANTYSCEIFIEYEKNKVNVKNYDEMKRGLKTQGQNLLFYFNGIDEANAEHHIEQLFEQ